MPKKQQCQSKLTHLSIHYCPTGSTAKQYLPIYFIPGTQSIMPSVTRQEETVRNGSENLRHTLKLVP